VARRRRRHRAAPQAPARHPVPGLLGQPAPRGDAGRAGQPADRHREGLQHLPAGHRRPAVYRQRAGSRPRRLRRLRPAGGGLDRQQGDRPRSGAGHRRAGQAAQPGRPEPGLQEFPGHAAGPQRAGPRRHRGVVRPAGPDDARRLRPGQGGDRPLPRREAGRGEGGPAPLALPEPLLPGRPQDLPGGPRRLLRRQGPGEAGPGLLRRNRLAHRRHHRPQRPVREAGQVPARLLHRHRPGRRRPDPLQPPAELLLDEHPAPRGRPRRVLEVQRSAAPLAAPRRGPLIHHRSDRQPVRPFRRPSRLAAGYRGDHPGRARRHQHRRDQFAAPGTARVLPLVPGDVPL